MPGKLGLNFLQKRGFICPCPCPGAVGTEEGYCQCTLLGCTLEVSGKPWRLFGYISTKYGYAGLFQNERTLRMSGCRLAFLDPDSQVTPHGFLMPFCLRAQTSPEHGETYAA